MAITLADFNKIWASTSPLTPYSFSESNYKQGWNFIGSTPPARQMWDFLQKNNDEKMQYLANNYLPLSGGTLNGGITSSVSTFVNRTTDDGYIGIFGGTADGKGSHISLYGKDHATRPGRFSIRATDGVNSLYFVGTPSGSLTWGGNNVLTSAEAKAGLISLSDDYATLFTSGADLDNYTTAGTYISNSSAITNSLSNCPVSSVGFKMIVLYVGYGTIAYGGTQIIFSSGGIYARRNSGTVNNVTWGAWKTIVSY